METIIGEGGVGGGDVVTNTTTEAFVADVIEASAEAPVILDLWAEWCGPCKQLGPVLESAVRATKGKVKLVKLNIDDAPQIAQQLRVQSIPAVFAFHNGQPVDGFVGALPESQIKVFVDKLAKTSNAGAGIEEAFAQAKAAFEADDKDTARTTCNQILEQDPAHLSTVGLLARCHVDAGEIDAAAELLDALEDEARSDSEIASALAALDLARQAGSVGGNAAELEARITTDPNDHQARYDLALVRFGAGEREGAVDALLEIIAQNREWNEGAAKAKLLELFDAFGADDDVTLSGRRRLSSILFS
jgi:putative thioredoxin